MDSEWLSGSIRLASPFVVALALGGFFKLCSLQAQRPAQRDGSTRYLSPGLFIYGPMLGSGMFVFWLLWFSLFVGINPNSSNYRMELYSYLAVIAAMCIGFLFCAYVAAIETRWDEIGVVQIKLGGSQEFISWSDLFNVNIGKSGDVVLRGNAGQKVYFIKFMPGALELIEECQARIAANKERSERHTSPS